MSGEERRDRERTREPTAERPPKATQTATEPTKVIQCVVVIANVKMAAVVSKTLISSSKRGFMGNIPPVAGYVAQRKYAIRPAEIPTAK